MAERILIAYATKCGSTAEVAQAVGDVLREAGAEVDVHPVDAVKDVSPYRAAIVGTAIRVGACLPETKRFVETHRDALASMPVAFFCVCLAVKETDPEQRQPVEEYLAPLREIVSPVQEGHFAGVMEYIKLPLFTRLMIRMMNLDQGDFRDWDAIRAWAQKVYPLLSG
ncbi:MAG: flavodoxin domain-containing protein [Anaerolineae bacterium]|nr:flavodoxin domain-containing protein [Anaerolineae bacterium]